jgi:hypothetical protein
MGDEKNEDNKSAASKGKKSCWDCGYQQIAGDTFLGKCTWFSKHNRGQDKEIPAHIVDVGCDHFVQRG